MKKFNFLLEEEEEEKLNNKKFDFGIGMGAKPLIEGLPMSTPTTPIQTPFGTGASVAGGATLFKPLIEDLPISKPEDKPDPTWGDVVKYRLKAGTAQFQASLVNLFRLVDMGVTKLTDPISKIISIDPEKAKAFKQKYGVDPNINTTDMLTKIVEESE